MMSERNKKLLSEIVLGLLITVGVVALNWKSEFPISQKLCDGFFVAAVVIMGSGGLKFVRNQGTFDAAAFGIGTALRTAMPFMKHNFNEDGTEETIHDYRERKKKERNPVGTQIWVGLGYLVLSFVALAVYMATA